MNTRHCGKKNILALVPALARPLLAVLVLALAACDGQSGSGESGGGGQSVQAGAPAPSGGQASLPAEPTESAEPAEPEYGGRLRMGSIGEPSNLIPPLASDSASSEVSQSLYIAPLKYDKDYNIVLWAAAEWEVLDNGLHMKFRLRDGLTWQDGHTLNADDVAFTYRLMIDPATPTAYAADYLNVKEFVQTGPLSFEVFYEAPFARSAVTWMHAILPKHILEHEDIATTAYARNPVGAGPFKLRSWESGSRIVLEANDLYFEGRPYLDEFVYRFIPDLTTIFLEAKAGGLDYLGLTPQQYLRQTSGPEWDSSWVKYRYLADGYTYLGFNLESPLFRDVRVRQALAHAVDRKAIIAGALLGLGETTLGPYKPGAWVYNENLQPYAHDPERARALLAEAGWLPGEDGLLHKDGLPFRFTILVNQGNEERINVATILQQQFKPLGVQVEIRTVEWAAFLKEFVHKGNFDALILAWNILVDPDIYDVWHSSSIAGEGLNFVHFRNEEADEMLDLGRRTVDQSERKRYYDRFQEILHEEQPYLFLYVPYSLPMIQARFQGVEPAPSGISHNMEKWWVPRALQQ